MRHLIVIFCWTSFALLALSVGARPTHAQTKVTIVLGDGFPPAPIPDVLIIVKSLDKPYDELIRALTDKSGNVPPLSLKPGLYRAIATTPYGVLQTSVREFLVKADQTAMWVYMPIGAKREVDRVEVGHGPQVYVHVVKADGSPAEGARVIARSKDLAPNAEDAEDLDPNTEDWYQTAANGWVAVDLFGKPTVVVIVYGDILVTREVAEANQNLVVHLPDK